MLARRAVVIAGLGFGSLTLVVNTAMASQPGRRGVLLVNLVNGVFGLGATAGPALLGLTQNVGYAYLFGALAVAVILATPPRQLGSSTPPARVDGHLATPATTNPTLLILFGALLFSYTGLETGLSSWEAVHLEAHGYPAATATALTSLFWLGLATGRLLIPLVTAGWPPARLIIATLTGALLALALVSISGAAPAGYLLAGVMAGPVLPTALAWNAATQPNPRRANAVVITAAMVGNVTLPAAIGYAMQATSNLALPALIAIPVLSCLTLAAILRRRTSHHTANAPVTRAT